MKLDSKRAKEIRRLRKNYPGNKITKEYVSNLYKNAINTPELARIVGAINGDGHLQYNEENYRYLTSFNSNLFYEILEFNKLFKSLFSKKPIIYKNHLGTKKNKIFYPGKEIALFMLLSGVVPGNKTNKEHYVPKWILNGNDNIKSSYLQGLFDTEGHISPPNKRQRITINQHKVDNLVEEGKIYMEQICSLLNKFNIKTSPVHICKGKTRKDGTKTKKLKFEIKGSEFSNFKKHIGFNNRKKLKRLNQALNLP